MYCFRCGKKLPARVATCPECDTPQKRRLRYRRRMILGLFIFLAGAVAGSLFDTFFFKGQAWDHSFMGAFNQTDQPELPQHMEEAPPIEHDHSSSEPMDTATAIQHSVDEVLPAQETPEDSAGSQDQIESAAVAHEESSQEQDDDQSASQADLSAIPEGLLVYDSCDPLEQGDGSNFHAHISHDGKKLVFASNRLKVNGKNTYQCFIKSPDAAAKPEIAFSWPGNIWTPEMTSDGNRIVFSSDSEADEHIFAYDLKAKKSQQLTSGKTKNMMSAISPDGNLIVYVSNHGGKNDLWLMGVDGSNPIQITSSPEEDRDPRWSADGRSVVFARVFDRLKKSQIMRISLDPIGEPEIVVSRSGRNWLPDISPCSSTLAFVHSESADGSKNTIYLKNLQSGEETPIKPLGEAEYFRPIWTSDASGLVFHANVGQNRSIYLARFRRE